MQVSCRYIGLFRAKRDFMVAYSVLAMTPLQRKISGLFVGPDSNSNSTCEPKLNLGSKERIDVFLKASRRHVCDSDRSHKIVA